MYSCVLSFFLLNIMLMRVTYGNLTVIACSFLLIYNITYLYTYILISFLLIYNTLLVIPLYDNTMIYLCVLSLMNFCIVSIWGHYNSAGMGV